MIAVVVVVVLVKVVVGFVGVVIQVVDGIPVEGGAVRSTGQILHRDPLRVDVDFNLPAEVGHHVADHDESRQRDPILPCQLAQKEKRATEVRIQQHVASGLCATAASGEPVGDGKGGTL
uniref:Uncharacterized protein n=1 Tax=Anopheles atroparvus TaxID=41427 RepID=A0A182J1I8_ANOAO